MRAMHGEVELFSQSRPVVDSHLRGQRDMQAIEIRNVACRPPISISKTRSSIISNRTLRNV
jgi:hypothetical protein